jgi:hypothetical protein
VFPRDPLRTHSTTLVHASADLPSARPGSALLDLYRHQKFAMLRDIAALTIDQRELFMSSIASAKIYQVSNHALPLCSELNRQLNRDYFYMLQSTFTLADRMRGNIS